MKKGIAMLFACACLPAWSLDWKLPVFTVKYEIAQGESEDPDDETLQPASLRNTVSLRVKEDAEPAAFGLTLKYSAKEYFLQSGDYSYFQLEHDGAFRLGDAWKLGYTLGAKGIEFPQPDSQGLSKDTLSLRAGSSATLVIAKGTNIEAGLSGRCDVAENPADVLQAYVVTAGFASRLGDWQLSTRYRGEFRLPLGVSSDVGTAAYNTGSLSLQWDPNR